MARSHYVYVLLHNHGVRPQGVWTVKHEMISYLIRSNLDMLHHSIWRYRDGSPDRIRDSVNITFQILKEIDET